MQKIISSAKPLIMSLVICLLFLPMTAIPVQAADSDFVIEDGMLTKYKGPGGHVEIPYGVTKIGGNAFSAHSGDGKTGDT